MGFLIAFYLPTVLLAAGTALLIDWQVAAARKQTFRVWRRLPLALLIGVAIAVMMRYA